MQKDIVLLGIQGCGKGTQAKIIKEKLENHLYYEMGQTLRAFTSSPNLIGDYIKDVINSGKLVDNYITFELIDISLQIAQKNQKFVMIDGFPRVKEQADFFTKKMADLGRDFVVVNFELSKEKAIERMMKRAEIEGRKDDTPEIMEKRLNTFFENTLPVIKEYEQMGKVITVNADDTIENISKDLMTKLGIN